VWRVESPLMTSAFPNASMVDQNFAFRILLLSPYINCNSRFGNESRPRARKDSQEGGMKKGARKGVFKPSLV
jgi:hypothetical protein